MSNLDKHGFAKVRNGVNWQVLSNFKTSGMKITITLKQNPRGRRRKILEYSGVIHDIHWDDMDEYVSLKDDNNKIHKFMVEDLYKLETFKINEGEVDESVESNET